MKAKTIEEKYTSMNEIQHIISRSGMYVGSTSTDNKQLFLYDNENNKMVLSSVTYSPAMFKLFDEIISNSCDEYRRKDNMGINEITVDIDTNEGIIAITDNGGIPVVIHKDVNMYVPEFIFGQLRTSSNYNDQDDDRKGIGLNGLGSVLTNIFSEIFNVITCDKKRKISVTWKNHMSSKIIDKIEKSKDHYTKVQYKLDFSLFDGYNLNEYTDDFAKLIEKRCIDAAVANMGITVKYNLYNSRKKIYSSEWNFTDFMQYISLYSDYFDEDDIIEYKDNKKQIWFCPDGLYDIAFVNGAECSKGTHIKAVRDIINKSLYNVLQNKHKLTNITLRNIDTKYSIFGIFDISNPIYSNQTKDELSTLVDNFYKDKSAFTISDKFVNQISKSEIIDIIKDWYQQKMEVEDQKLIRKLNKQAKTKIKNNDKFIDANSKKNTERELWLFEGDSARAGFRASRNPQTQAAYMLRGCVKNTYNAKPSDIMSNKELSDIISIIGLQFGETVDVKKLNFSKIVIATDADFDGHHICGLLLNFFSRWPELFDNKLICRSITPIIYAIKGNDTQKFYSMKEFKEKEKSLKGYKVLYSKGLGMMDNNFYKEMMLKPILHFYKRDELTDSNIRLWFNKTIASERKSAMKNEV